MSVFVTVAEGADKTRDLPVSSYVVGAVVLIFFFVLMFGLLTFGRGREHT